MAQTGSPQKSALKPLSPSSPQSWAASLALCLFLGHWSQRTEGLIKTILTQVIREKIPVVSELKVRTERVPSPKQMGPSVSVGCGKTWGL